MQFYIIHPDPVVSAGRLPPYAVCVNVREGWQILSDIGHRFGVTWAGQNKPYNPYHPLTRSFSHWDGVCLMLNHYKACLDVSRPTVWHERWRNVPRGADFAAVMPTDYFAEVVHYLRTRKAKHLPLQWHPESPILGTP